MPDKTPRLNLDTYAEGEESWSHTDTVEAVDEYAIDRGPIKDRPDTGDYDDELYHATDQRITWRWDVDDSDWKAIAGMGSEESPLPGTTYRESLSTEKQSITGTSTPLPDSDTITTAGIEGEVQHAHFPSGGGFDSQPTRFVDHKVTGITSQSWTAIGPPITYGDIDHLPNLVPLVRLNAKVQSNDSGEVALIGLTTEDRGIQNPIVDVESGDGTGVNEVIEVFYPDTYDNLLSQNDTMLKWQLVARVTGGTSGMTIYPETSIKYGWEVV